MRRLAMLLIRLYRRWISPWKPDCCRFSPSCSAYGHEAFAVHGFAKGLLLTSWRVLRCQPLCRHGYDPVPPAGRWRHAERHLERCTRRLAQRDATALANSTP